MVDAATRKLIFPTPDPLFGWSKTGSVSIPDPFFLWKKKVLTSDKFYRNAINMTGVQEDFEKLLKNSMWHSGSFLQGAKKGLGGFWDP
jgi:hypothetical protein